METRDEKEAYVTHIYRGPTQTSAVGAGGAASSAESALTHLSMRSFSIRRFKFKQYYKKKKTGENNVARHKMISGDWASACQRHCWVFFPTIWL